MSAVSQMPYGTHGEEVLTWVGDLMICRFLEDGMPGFDDVLYREPFSEECAGGHLMAVGYHGACEGMGLGKAEDVSGSKGDEDEWATGEETVGLGDSVVALLKRYAAVGMGETGVMQPRMPQAVAKEQ